MPRGRCSASATACAVRISSSGRQVSFSSIPPRLCCAAPESPVTGGGPGAGGCVGRFVCRGLMASKRFLAALFFVACFQLPAFSSAAAPEKVRLELFYEALCPYCSSFIVTFLSKIFEDGLISIVDLNLLPYGNARVDANGTITCQHGPYECVLNTIEACAINVWPDVKVHFSFIYCVEQLVLEHKYGEWETCFQKTGLESKQVLDCYNNGYGQKLELNYAAETDALQPPHIYVPWVVVNGKPLYDDYETFEAEVCMAYKGDLPEACGGLLSVDSKLMKMSIGDPVCYVNDVVSSAFTSLFSA